MSGDDETGVRTTMLRGGTSRGLYFTAADLPTDPAVRDDLLLRLMGTPDPRQIDGLGGATSLTSKVAVVSPSPRDDADVDYLFLQLGVAEATVSHAQNCGNILAGVGPFAIERGLVPATDAETTVRIRMVNSDSVAVATVPTPGGRVTYRGDVAIAGVPGTAAGITLAFTDTEGSTTGALLPTGHVRDTVDGVEVTCVDNGMPVVLALASAFGLTGHETHEELAADTALAQRVDAFRAKAGALMGLGDVSASSVPKTVLLAPPTDGGQVATRSFIPVAPHTAIGVLAAVSVVTGMLLPDAVGHELTAGWPADSSRVDVEHPTGHFLVDVVVDTTATPPRVERSGVVRTARKLFDGTAFPRA
ncbi:4-oxalomesaconate tautomerase [Actinomycetospora sp. TBRC 11914]|uniref:4-oxalomesaconate tautomerase n=1 Tax=Actinomycetospora sp. TBRC 11914 TaxID=2729387 RepID=UPI00145EF4E7|nr:4-oxalomesaconate tautomerase [Actinomycetospora sp. TBRC 11914]NMO91725.1 4-oxalomesaconate tautomerase [Actinomycetospora sp. TBRC 11914]